MSQQEIELKPMYVATDMDEQNQKNDSAKFIKGQRISINSNSNNQNGSGSDMPMGNNFGAGTPTLSNIIASNVALPAGYNKNCGTFECIETNEFYYLNFNANGHHGIYVIEGDTGIVHTVLIDPTLNFSFDPAHEVGQHRAMIRVLYDTNKNGERYIREKHFIYTDGNNWQRWINVIAAIKTKGFDATLNPYWKLQPPHFDRRELIEYAVRPPMHCIGVKEIPLTSEDKRKRNGIWRKSTQFAVSYNLTDGRKTTLSQYSDPYYPTTHSMSNAPRCLSLTIYAGSPLVESIDLYRRMCNGDWVRYDRIYKYPTCEENDPAVIGDEYWKRIRAWQYFDKKQNNWSGYDYDAATNTIKYTYCADKECAIVSKEDALRNYTDVPLRSIALTEAGDSVLFGDNEYDYDNFSCETLRNLRLSLENPPQLGCIPKMVKISIYSVACRDGELMQFAYTDGENKTVRWGGQSILLINGHLNIDVSENDMFELDYKDNGGPICYLAGTPYFSIGQQYYVSASKVLTKVGTIDKAIADDVTNASDNIMSGGMYVMKYDFVVPAGNYIARLAHHRADISSDYQKTSTYVMGLVNPSIPIVHPGELSYTHVTNYAKEIEINACNGDVDTWTNGQGIFYVFVPYDYKEGTNRRWRFIEGYVYESKQDKIGIELLDYTADNGNPSYLRGGRITDHNGFYFQYTARGEAKKAKVAFSGNFNCHYQIDIIKSNDLPSKDRGWYKDNLNIADTNNNIFGACNRVVVKGFVKDVKGVGVDNVAVVITRGGVAYTTTDGSFELIVHNANVPRRLDRIYYMSSGADIITSITCGCIPVDNYDSDNSPCVNCQVRIYPIQLNKTVSIANSVTKGLKGGGRYGIGIIGHDLAGRSTYVNHIGYVDIPTIIESGVSIPPQIKVTKIAGLNLPKDISYVSFARTRNLNNATYIQWVGDKIIYLDRQGNEISGTNGAVRAKIVIQSLLEYNKENNFSTTTTYQFVRGDYIRFYDDGEGNYFKPNQSGFLDLQILGTNWEEANANTDSTTGEGETGESDGAVLIVPFDRRLTELKDKCGFWIEINRPNDCTQKEQYCEMCGMYPVIDGEIAPEQILLNTWDTYHQSRLIINKLCAGKAILHPFESTSITDYWGEDCTSCGRVYITNDDATRRWYPDDIIKSDDWVNEGGYNGLGTMRFKNRKKFKGQITGGIVAMHAERKIIFCLCENDWFTVDFELNVVRINNNGVAIANLDQAMSDQNQKIGDNYGLSMEHTRAVLFEQGLVFWADYKCAGIIMSDYRTTKKISDIDNESYFISKMKFVQSFNLCQKGFDEIIDTILGYDPLHQEVLVTWRPRRGRSVAPHSFANDEREIKIQHQETFTFSIGQQKWARWENFCPEGYGTLRNAKAGICMIAFAAGVPHYHNARHCESFLNYFSVQTHRVVDVVVTAGRIRMIYQSFIVDDKSMKWFIDRIYTDEANSFSYVPLTHIKKKENEMDGPFLRDMNSFNFNKPYSVMLFDGKRLFGKFARLRFVADPTKSAEYSEMKSIRVKVTTSEITQKAVQ